MRPLGLVESFAIRSFVVVVIMAGLLGWAVTTTVESIFTREATRSAQLMANALVIHHVDVGDLAEPLAGDAKASMLDLARNELLHSGIFAVKLWSTTGTLVFSSDADDPVGTSFADDADIQRALAGETVAEVIRQPEDENEQQFAKRGALIEVYAPLTGGGSDSPIGIFEIYQSYAPVLKNIRSTNAIIWGIVVLGAIPSYLAQVTLMKRAADRLKQTEEEVTEVNTRLEGSMKEIEEHSLGTLQALTAAVDAKDSYTARHSLSVTDYAVAIGKRLNLSLRDMIDLERAGLLHDIGKIGVSETVLLKPSRLSDEELSIIKDHSDIGAHIIESIPFLKDLIPIVRYHHERWDGSGYPEGLAGEQTPHLARILAVADAFDAMTSDRPYRPAMRVASARKELLRFRGIQFDPAVVDALLVALDAGEIHIARTHVSVRSLREAVSA